MTARSQPRPPDERKAAIAANARRRYHLSEENRKKNLAATKKWVLTHPEKYRELVRNNVAKARANNPRLCILRNAAQSARKRDLQFNLTEDDLVWPTHCPVLGIELVYFAPGYRQNASVSIDRFDNSIGYIKGNVRVISWRANNLKGDATLAELQKVVAYMQGSAP